jgi:two-component system cell cycle sensor histidine kinase/response regulator CckA
MATSSSHPAPPPEPALSWSEGLKPWQVLALALVIGELLTALIVMGFSLLFHGEIATDYLITGAVTCAVVATLIVALVLRWTRQLAEARARLEATRQERDALQEQLLRSQKLEAVGQLAGGVAHDFNNILGGILSNVHYLQTRGPGLEAEPLEEVLSDIRTGVDRGARLCGNLLAFSRHLPSEVARVSVAEVVDTTVRLHRRTFDRSIRIETRVPAELHVQASRAEIEQVLMNLCLNARDAMPAGGELTISARAIDEGRTVELEVRDTGHGMDATTRERAFEPFYTTSRPGEGSGLGLSVAYGIVRAHGGTLELDSAPDAGCRMRILLPSAPAAQGQAPAEASAPGDRPDGRGLHVLLIDDEPLALRATSRFLKSVGFRVTAVPCGDDALARVRDREAAIDLVVLDMVMPGMDGEQTLRAMRGAGLTAPVLLVSGFDGGRRVERCLEDGAEGFLAKPVDPSTLVRELERLAGRPARADSA